MISKFLLAAAVLAAMLAGPSIAQQAEAPPPPPPSPQVPPSCDSDVYRAFDFWVGEWDVRQPDGSGNGHNSIQPINRGCALLENYSMGGVSAGQSYNFYDSVRGTWSQLWLSPGAIIRIEGPAVEPGALTMTGTITYANQPAPRPFMGRWTARDDGSVLQQFWERDPATGEWGVWFTGIYTRTE